MTGSLPDVPMMAVTTAQQPKPIERYIQILEIVASSANGLTLGDIAKLLDLPKPSAHRLVNTLLELEVLSAEDGRNRRFRIGRRLWRILYLGQNPDQAGAFAQIIVEELAQKLTETTYIVRLHNGAVRSIAQSVPDQGYRLHVVPGDRLPLHAAASAKSILAFQPSTTVDVLLTEPLDPLTPYTKIDRAVLAEELADVRRQGFAVCDREIDESVMAFACPVHLTHAGTLYAVGVTGPVTRLTKRPADYWVSPLASAASRFAQMLESFPETDKHLCADAS